jgi:protein arginine kinase
VPQSEAFDSWLETILKAVQPPLWLVGDAPWRDVVLSSRVRIMRNLDGFRFPHRGEPQELEEVRLLVKGATSLEERAGVSDAERAMLVGSRLVAPHFDWDAPGRALLLNRERSLAVMVNEEDHLRIQAVTPGLSPLYADQLASSVESNLGKELRFARSELGYLAASSANVGEGRRVGIMVHLAGLACTGRIGEFADRLEQEGYEVRGPLGEGSPGWGGLVQISSTRKSPWELYSAARCWIGLELRSRNQLDRSFVKYRISEVSRTISESKSLTAHQAVRLLGWLRLGALTGALDVDVRAIDGVASVVWLGDDDSAWCARRARVLKQFDRFSSAWTRR